MCKSRTVKTLDWEKNLKPKQRSNIPKVKAGRWYEQMLAEGLTPFTEEWRKRHNYLSKKANYDNVKEHKNARRKELQKADPEKYREKWRKRKAEERASASERINKNNRARYHANKTIEAARQRLRAWNRKPHRAIRALTNLYLQGLLTDEQYLERVDEYIERAEQITGSESIGGSRK